MSLLGELRLKRREGGSRYDTDAPWVVWHFLTTDQRTRITGRMVLDMECAGCGRRRRMHLRIPRFGDVPVPRGGKHAARARFILDHIDCGKQHPMAWARPLLNPAAHPGGLDLDLLAMRLEADLRAHAD